MSQKVEDPEKDEIMQRIVGYHNLKVEKTSVVVKKFPFIYTALLLALTPFEAWISLEWAEALGLLTFTSVPSILLCWRLSHILKMCRWHRVQCLLTILPVLIPLCRIFWPGIDVVWVWAGISVVLIASLVNCYKTFIRPTRMG